MANTPEKPDSRDSNAPFHRAVRPAVEMPNNGEVDSTAETQEDQQTVPQTVAQTRTATKRAFSRRHLFALTAVALTTAGALELYLGKDATEVAQPTSPRPRPIKEESALPEAMPTQETNETPLQRAISAYKSIFTSKQTGFYPDDDRAIVMAYKTPDALAPIPLQKNPSKTQRRKHNKAIKIQKAHNQQWHDANRLDMMKRKRDGRLPTDTKINMKPGSERPIANSNASRISKFSSCHKRAKENVNGERAMDTTQRVFGETLGKLKIAEALGGKDSKTFKHFIKLCALGQVSQESTFKRDEDHISPSNARGPFQLTPDDSASSNDMYCVESAISHHRHIYKGDDRIKIKSPTYPETPELFELEYSSTIIAMYYDEIYHYINRRKGFDNLAEKLGMETGSEAFIESLLIPILINAHHNGQGDMNKFIKWFNKDGEVPDPMPTGHNIFQNISQQYYLNGKNGDYGKRSFSYYQQICAWTELLEEAEGGTDVEEKYSFKHPKADPENRMDLEKAKGRSLNFKHSYRIATNFENGARGINVPDDEAPDADTQAYGKELDRLEAAGMDKYRTKNGKALKQLRTKHGANLKNLSHTELAYRYGSIGDEKMAFLLQPTLDELVPDITKELNEVLWANGMDQKYFVRPHINSAYRTEEYHKGIGGNASKFKKGSHHFRAQTFDLSYLRCYIIDLDSFDDEDLEFEYYEVGPNRRAKSDENNISDKKRRINNGFNQRNDFMEQVDRAMAQVTNNMIKTGRIYAIREEHSNCYHISDKNPEL